MAKKKAAKKKTVKKKVSKRNVVKKKTPVKKKVVKKVARPKNISRRSIRGGRRLRLTVQNLLFFVILFIVSYVLKLVSGNQFSENLFFLLALAFGFISIALLIVVLILFFLRLGRR